MGSSKKHKNKDREHRHKHRKHKSHDRSRSRSRERHQRKRHRGERVEQFQDDQVLAQPPVSDVYDQNIAPAASPPPVYTQQEFTDEGYQTCCYLFIT